MPRLIHHFAAGKVNFFKLISLLIHVLLMLIMLMLGHVIANANSRSVCILPNRMLVYQMVCGNHMPPAVVL